MNCMYIHQASLSWERKTTLLFFHLKKVTSEVIIFSRLTEILWEGFCSCCVCLFCFLKMKPKASLICPTNQKGRLLQVEQEVMIVTELSPADHQGARPLSFHWSMLDTEWSTQVKPGGTAACNGQPFWVLGPQVSTPACIPSRQSGGDPAFSLHSAPRLGCPNCQQPGMGLDFLRVQVELWDRPADSLTKPKETH